MVQKTTELTRGNWKMDYFFRKQGYYTLIFDNEKQIKFSKSTDLDSVIVEKIHLKRGTIEQYWFDHQDGSWKLNQIRNITFKDSYNASFYTFLSHFFATGGKGAVKSSLAYSGPDPNGEETNVVNTTIPAEEWSSFLPELPHEMIYNILMVRSIQTLTAGLLPSVGCLMALKRSLSLSRMVRAGA